MMTTEISHYQTMLHCNRDRFTSEAEYWLERLWTIAASGGFITSETIDARQLEAGAIVLRTLADRMMNCRAALLANEPKPYAEAAE